MTDSAAMDRHLRSNGYANIVRSHDTLCDAARAPRTDIPPRNVEVPQPVFSNPPRWLRCYHGRMDDFEKKWRRIQEQLRIQMNGDEQPRISSGRTLFGIQSEGERKMEEFARQIEQERQEKQNRNESDGEQGE